MPITLATLTMTLGGFDFAPNFPLVGRQIQSVRGNEDSTGGIRRVQVTLRGFFLGNEHKDLYVKYLALQAAISTGAVDFVYTDSGSTANPGVLKIYNGRVYIDSLSEPEDWKMYDGEYTIAFHYFEKYTSNDLITNASYTGSAGTINFSPCPTWSHNIKPHKASSRQSRLAPSGAKVGSVGTISLHGKLVNSSLHGAGTSFPAVNPDPTTLMTEMARWENILHQGGSTTDGTLNYGAFSKAVIFEEISWGAGIPNESIDYEAKFTYDLEAIIELSVKRSYSRINFQPQIDELRYCNARLIRLGNISGQEVTYTVKLRADTISHARSLLATELAVLVTAGGIEMPGGVETWDEDNRSVDVTIKKFHNFGILSNII